MNLKRLTPLTLAAAAAFALVLAGCGGGGKSDSGGASSGGNSSVKTYVGQLSSSDAYVALVFNGKTMLAYLCDGNQTAEWLRGPVGAAGGGYFQLQSADGAEIEGRPNGDTYVGLATPISGEHFQYTATLVKGDKAGLFRAKETIDGADWSEGWVVLADGSFKGARRSSTGSVVGMTSLGGTHWIDPDTDP
jgi:hypothetical protein